MSEIQDKQQYIMSLRKDNSISTENGGPPTWLISFTDVIALMLTFFVLLYAMSSPDVEKFERKVGITMQSEADFSGDGNQAGADEGLNINRIEFNLAEDLQYLEALFNRIVQDKNLENSIQIKGRGDLLMLYLHPTMQINNRDFLIFLNNLEPVLESLDNRLEIVGSPESMGIFSDLQSLGRVLKSYGYNQAVSVSVRDLSASDMRPRMAIAIRSNDGRRVVYPD